MLVRYLESSIIALDGSEAGSTLVFGPYSDARIELAEAEFLDIQLGRQRVRVR